MVSAVYFRLVNKNTKSGWIDSNKVTIAEVLKIQNLGQYRIEYKTLKGGGEYGQEKVKSISLAR